MANMNQHPLAKHHQEGSNLGGHSIMRNINLNTELFSNSSPAPEAIFDFCSRLYNSHRYTSINGETNPYDPRYYQGGVHFSRSPEWFAEHLKIEGARLLVVNAEPGEPAGFAMFFLNPPSFPAFAGSSLPLNNIPALKDRVGYTYFILIDPQYRGSGVAINTMRAICSLAQEAGCLALLHEYCRNPIPNLASTMFHERKLVAEFGAVHLPFTSHLILQTSSGETRIEYAQCLVPCSTDLRLKTSFAGLEIELKGLNMGATPWSTLAASI